MSAVNSQDSDAQLPTEVTRLDGKDVTQSLSTTGQTTSQGVGDSKNAPHITPATYQYDPLTGKLSGLTLFPTGSTSNTTGQEITGFSYDPATALESKKTYADGSIDTFTYNNKLQLASEDLRGDSTTFNYNTAGMQTGASYNGSGTTINDSLGTLDDLGRSHVATETTTSIDGSTATTDDVLNYNGQGQVASETQTSGVTVHYDYYQPGDTSQYASLGSIKDMQLKQGSVVISETDYAYDPISKRLATITINGVPYTYTYMTNTNLIESVGTSANAVTYGYESNTGRLQSISAGTDYSASYTYTANDQRLTEHVLQENPDTQAIDERNWTFNYDDLDQLASVTDDGVTLYSYPYDAVGNRTDASSVNTMNQYSGLQYNGQGDVIDDGQFSYTWDAKGRLTSATPDSPDAQSQKDVFTYDPENRRTQEDIYAWRSDDQTWVYASSMKFVYDGSQMVAELDGQDRLLQSYIWGPTGTLLSITDYTGSAVKNYQVVTDGSGSVVELLDSSTGLVAASYQYDPWGNPTSATGPAATLSPFRWQGEFYDASFGGYYMGAREGSARLHIFLSPDPSGEGSDPNLYRMVGNDPINKTDPTGLSPESDITGDYYGGLDEVGRKPSLLATPTSRYFMPAIIIRSIFWDGPIMIGRGIRTAYGEAKSGLTDELSKTPADATGQRAALRAAQGFVRVGEPITYGTFLYSQYRMGTGIGELAPAWMLKAAKVSAPVVIPTLTGMQIGRVLAAPKGSLRVEDYMDLAAIALMWRTLPAIGEPVVAESQFTLGANRFFKPSVQITAEIAARADMADLDLELPPRDREMYLGELPQTLKRPTLRANTIKAIEAAAERDPNGFPVEPYTQQSLKGGYVYGHKTGFENWRLIDYATQQGMTQAEFNDWVNAHPEWFQIQSKATNSSHLFEAK